MAPSREEDDPRLPALAAAVRGRQIVRLRARSNAPIEVQPVALGFEGADWQLTCARGDVHARCDWADINISARRF